MKPFRSLLLSLLLTTTLHAGVPWTIEEWEARWNSIDESQEKKHIGDREIGGDEIGGAYSARSYQVWLSKSDDKAITAAIRMVAIPSVKEIVEYSFMIMETDAEGKPALPPEVSAHKPTPEEIAGVLELLSGKKIQNLDELEKLPITSEELGAREGFDTREARRLTEDAILIVHHVLYSGIVRFEIRKSAH